MILCIYLSIYLPVVQCAVQVEHLVCLLTPKTQSCNRGSNGEVVVRHEAEGEEPEAGRYPRHSFPEEAA